MAISVYAKSVILRADRGGVFAGEYLCVDKRYFSASAAQQAFFTEVLPDALAGRGGWHLGSGYYSYKPTGCVELGGDMRTVGVSELIVFNPHRASGCGHGCCPKHGWAERKHINTAGLTRTSRRDRVARARFSFLRAATSTREGSD